MEMQLKLSLAAYSLVGLRVGFPRRWHRGGMFSSVLRFVPSDQPGPASTGHNSGSLLGGTSSLSLLRHSLGRDDRVGECK
jgi:hypothetical protein